MFSKLQDPNFLIFR